MNNEMETAVSIADNLRFVRSRIEAACGRSGRRPEEVTLIAVSKRKPFSDILEACASGAADFGENYVQELTQKIEQNNHPGAGRPIRWHMIGHLQKNKVKYLIGRTALVHSVDSVPLAEQIEKEAAKKDQLMRILLEVNIAGEESKWGFDPDSVFRAAAFMNGRDYVIPDDVQTVFAGTVAHRLLLTADAQAQGIREEQLLTGLLKQIPAPGV